MVSVSIPSMWLGHTLAFSFSDDIDSNTDSHIVVRMESNTSITIPSSGRLVTVLEPAVLDLVMVLGLEEDAYEELLGLVALVPPEWRIAYLLGVYDDLAVADVEPDDSNL